MGLNSVISADHLSELEYIFKPLWASVSSTVIETKIPTHRVVLTATQILSIKYLAQCLACGKSSLDGTLKEVIFVLPG